MSLRLALFWREHGRGSRITCLSSEGSSACWICSMSVTDLAPFRLPLKEVLRESDLTWEGRGVGESASTRLERVDAVLTCMARSLRSADSTKHAKRVEEKHLGVAPTSTSGGLFN